MSIFDVALEKRFDESTELVTVDLTDDDTFLIRDSTTGVVLKLKFSTLKAGISAAFSTTFAALVSGKVPDSQLPDSGHIAEGTNKYYTDARSRAAISVTGSLGYNPTTGVLSYTTPSSLPASDVYAWAKASVKPSYTYGEVGAQVAGSYPTGSGTSSGANTGDQTITLTGDVTGSGTGSFAATIAAAAVSLAKMANMATASVFYRKTAGNGAPEVQTLATLKTDLGLTGTNSGDQTLASLGAEAAITAGTNAKYWRGDKTFQTLNQAAVAGLTTTDKPTFAGVTSYKGQNANVGPGTIDIATPSDMGGLVILTSRQGGVGTSTRILSYVNNAGTLTLTAIASSFNGTDPMTGVAVSGSNIRVTLGWANTNVQWGFVDTPV